MEETTTAITAVKEDLWSEQSGAAAGRTQEGVLQKPCQRTNPPTAHLLLQKLWTSATESTMKKDYWQI